MLLENSSHGSNSTTFASTVSNSTLTPKSTPLSHQKRNRLEKSATRILVTTSWKLFGSRGRIRLKRCKNREMTQIHVIREIGNSRETKMDPREDLWWGSITQVCTVWTRFHKSKFCREARTHTSSRLRFTSQFSRVSVNLTLKRTTSTSLTELIKLWQNEATTTRQPEATWGRICHKRLLPSLGLTQLEIAL